MKNFTARPVLHTIFQDGVLEYDVHPDVHTIKQYSADSLDLLWNEYKRMLNPEPYPVDLSQDLYDSKVASIQAIKKRVNAIKDNEEE